MRHESATATVELRIPEQRRPPDVEARPSLSRWDPVFPLVERLAPVAVRLSLAAVYLWFGLLKVVGRSPVAELVSSTIPFGDPSTVVTVLGAVEVALGLALVVGLARRPVLIAVAGHLAGTFLTVVMAPGLLVRNGNPLLLTADGEFVLKNLVLISAALLLLVTVPPAPRRSEGGHRADHIHQDR